MTISNNGFDCEEMYAQPCTYELEAVRMGTPNYVCSRCGALAFGGWLPDENKPQQGETK
jgi:hypothetical protein